MIKTAAKQFLRRAGIYLTRPDRLGLDVELDLARLSADRPLKTIFDVGANFGQTAVRMAAAFPQADIYSFEPVPDSFQKLRQATHSLDRVKLFNLALGDVAGTAPIFIGDSAATNSLIAGGHGGKEVMVQVETLCHFADANQIKKIDLLKIDVEGFELSVLRGSEPWLENGRIRYLFCECVTRPTPNSPHTSFFELHQYLERFGFCFFNYYPEYFDLKSASAMGNVLFARVADLPSSVRGSIANIQ